MYIFIYMYQYICIYNLHCVIDATNKNFNNMRIVGVQYK